MWIDKRLPALRRHPTYGLFITAGLIAGTVAVIAAFPELPSFQPLYPVVLLSAFFGGRQSGIIAWAVCTLLGAYYFWQAQPGAYPGIWDYVTVFSFSAVCALIVFIVGLLDKSIERLQRERQRLNLALESADLATWELQPGGKLIWDDHFFRMIGLDPAKDTPSVERFLAMVHPEDRLKMAEARQLMGEGRQPISHDGYRLTRPDGRMVWLENYRAAVRGEANHFIGITQNVSARKRAEKRITMLMRELAHRVKNQYAVIMAMVRETNKQSATPEEFEKLIQERILALSRSHDLLIHGEWESTDLRQLLFAHVEAFGVVDRLTPEGPDISLSASAAQYLGMAFHELATNAAKHGAFSSPEGRVSVTWSIDRDSKAENAFTLSWQEHDGPPVTKNGDGSTGFGSKVLQRLTPGALAGIAETKYLPSGLIWSLTAPVRPLLSTDDNSSEAEFSGTGDR